MANGIVQDNGNVTDLVNKLKASKVQYPVLNKKQERERIERYKDDEMRWRDLLIMHNLRSVFNISKKYSKTTKSYDDMVQRGMLGLVIASRKFDPTVKKLNEKTGKVVDIKFSTFANYWIFKFVTDEFYTKNIKVDLNSVSINAPCEFGRKDSSSKSYTYENYVDECASPDYTQSRPSPLDELSSMEQVEIVNHIYSMIDASSDLSAVQKQVFVEMFKNKKHSKDIARDLNIDQKEVIEDKAKIVKLIKNDLIRRYGISSIDDIW